MPARQFISGGLGPDLLREQKQHLVGRVRQVQEPGFFLRRSHGLAPILPDRLTSLLCRLAAWVFTRTPDLFFFLELESLKSLPTSRALFSFLFFSRRSHAA